MQQWHASRAALEEVRRRELRALSAESALAAADALLSLAARTTLLPSRWEASGLVEQQALLHRHRP
jgi:hypothetical protein